MCIGLTEKEIPEIIPPALMRSYLKYCVQLLGPQLKKDMDLFESVQRKVLKRIRGVEHFSYEERLKKLRLFSWEKKKL